MSTCFGVKFFVEGPPYKNMLATKHLESPSINMLVYHKKVLRRGVWCMIPFMFTLLHMHQCISIAICSIMHTMSKYFGLQHVWFVPPQHENKIFFFVWHTTTCWQPHLPQTKKKVGHRHVWCAPPQHEKNFFCLPHHNMLATTLTTDEKKSWMPTCLVCISST